MSKKIKVKEIDFIVESKKINAYPVQYDALHLKKMTEKVKEINEEEVIEENG